MTDQQDTSMEMYSHIFDNYKEAEQYLSLIDGIIYIKNQRLKAWCTIVCSSGPFSGITPSNPIKGHNCNHHPAKGCFT